MSNRHEVVAQTKTSSFLCINYLAGQHQFACAFLTNYARKKHGRHRGKHAELDFGLAEFRSLGSDDNVTGGHQLAASTECWSVHHGDSRLRYLIQQPKDLVKGIQHLENCV